MVIRVFWIDAGFIVAVGGARLPMQRMWRKKRPQTTENYFMRNYGFVCGQYDITFAIALSFF